MFLYMMNNKDIQSKPRNEFILHVQELIRIQRKQVPFDLHLFKRKTQFNHSLYVKHREKRFNWMLDRDKTTNNAKEE